MTSYDLGRIVQLVGLAAPLCAFAVGALCGVLLHYLATRRKANSTADRVADQDGAFDVVVGHVPYSGAQILVRVYRAEGVKA